MAYNDFMFEWDEARRIISARLANRKEREIHGEAFG